MYVFCRSSRILGFRFHGIPTAMVGVTMITVQRKMCGESWRCAPVLCHGMIITSEDMVDLMVPIMSAMGSNIITVCKHTLSPLAETIEGWSRKRTRWKSARNEVRPGRGRTHCVMSALVACPAGASGNCNHVHFDTDSCKIGIDNRCSACTSHEIGDFVGKLVDSNKTTKDLVAPGQRL